MAEPKIRKLVAQDHREAYDMWAKYFDDPALMANRDAKTNLLKLRRVAAQLPLTSEAAVLDVGPGDGALFRVIADDVSRCCGVDPSAAAIHKLDALFESAANVEFAIGASDAVPYEDDTFDIVVINSVLQMMPTPEDIANSLRELRRVCRPGGVIFVGELPFRPEAQNGNAAHLVRKFREYGPRNLARLLYHVYLLPVVRGEPMVLYPASNLFMPAIEFTAICTDLGLRVDAKRHQEPRRESLTRNDYMLQLPSTS